MRDIVLNFVADSLKWYAGLTGIGSGTAIEIGACDINGNARSRFVSQGWGYIGYDEIKGSNVDVVGSADDLARRFRPGEFDCVASLETLEHIPDLVRFVDQISWVLRPGGLFILSAAGNCFPVHRHPLDCWRILPDGMRWLLKRSCKETEDYIFHGMEGVLGRGIRLEPGALSPEVQGVFDRLSALRFGGCGVGSGKD